MSDENMTSETGAVATDGTVAGGAAVNGADRKSVV